MREVFTSVRCKPWNFSISEKYSEALNVLLTRITITYNNNNNYNTVSKTYSKQIISISLQTSSFDNVSHNAKPSRISHNSIISWQDPIWHDFCLFFSRISPTRWLASKRQSW